MKRVLLVTLQDANIGNRLQNYALQKTLQKFDCEVFTPIYHAPDEDTLKKRVKMKIKNMLYKCGMKKYMYDYIVRRRRRVFDKFTKHFISHPFRTSFNDCTTWNNYDLAITGSDQVWHKWSRSPKELPYFYLAKISRDKRIAYAPSFGFSKFPKDDIVQHCQGIKEIRKLSCREPKGKELIEKLTGRHAEVLPDPTILLKKNEWKEIERKPRVFPREKYVLCYFLGTKTAEYSIAIQKFAKGHKCQIVDIADENHLEYFYVDPSEFIWLLNCSEAVFTDSFHACVFSIVFHKPFMVFKRHQENFEDMFDRIKHLLSVCSLEQSEYNINGSVLVPNWVEVDNKLKASRKKGILYIKNAIGYI